MPIIFPLHVRSNGVEAARTGLAPHLKAPLTFNAKGAAETVGQDTEAEIANCVYNICSCLQGTREDLPAFGIADPTFQTLPLNLTALEEQIARWESRRPLTVTTEEQGGPARQRIVVAV